MGFWKRLDDKVVNYLKKQIEKQDKIAEELEKEDIKVKNDNENYEFLQSIEDIGLYFMDLFKSYKSSSNKNTKNRELILNYYYMLGCASQGRISEVKGILEENKNEYPMYNKIFIKHTPKILRMSEISKKVDDMNINLKDGESIGEYMNNKLLKRKTFVKEFMFFANQNIEELFI